MTDLILSESVVGELFRAAESRAIRCLRLCRMECRIGCANRGTDQHCHEVERWECVVNFVWRVDRAGWWWHLQDCQRLTQSLVCIQNNIQNNKWHLMVLSSLRLLTFADGCWSSAHILISNPVNRAWRFAIEFLCLMYQDRGDWRHLEYPACESVGLWSGLERFGWGFWPAAWPPRHEYVVNRLYWTSAQWWIVLCPVIRKKT